MAVSVYRNVAVFLFFACCCVAEPMGTPDSVALVFTPLVHARIFFGRSLSDPALGLHVLWPHPDRPGGSALIR